VLSVRIVGQVVSIIVAGILSDKVGRVPVLIVGYMFSASAFFVFTLVNDFGAMLLIAMLQGVGEGFGFTTLIALLTDLSPPNIRGGVVGIFRTFNDIGGFVGPIAFVLIYGGSRSANVFYICVVLNMICMALMLTLRARHNLIPIPK
jgi:MFS family permease